MKVEETSSEKKSEEEGEEMKDQNEKLIRVFVVRKNEAQPILAATITMPPSEISTLL